MAPEALTRFLNLGIDVVNPVTLNPWFKLGAWLFFGYIAIPLDGIRWYYWLDGVPQYPA